MHVESRFRSSTLDVLEAETVVPKRLKRRTGTRILLGLAVLVGAGVMLKSFWPSSKPNAIERQIPDTIATAPTLATPAAAAPPPPTPLLTPDTTPSPPSPTQPSATAQQTAPSPQPLPPTNTAAPNPSTPPEAAPRGLESSAQTAVPPPTQTLPAAAPGTSTSSPPAPARVSTASTALTPATTGVERAPRATQKAKKPAVGAQKGQVKNPQNTSPAPQQEPRVALIDAIVQHHASGRSKQSLTTLVQQCMGNDPIEKAFCLKAVCSNPSAKKSAACR